MTRQNLNAFAKSLLIFSVLCNHYLVPTSYVTRVQDSIAVRLSRLRGARGSGT